MRKRLPLSLVLLKAISCILVIVIGSLILHKQHFSVLAASTPLPLHISGNHIVDTNNTVVVLRGAARWSLEFSCGDGHFGLSDFQAMKSWGMNIVRLPLNENEFLTSSVCGGNYQNTVYTAVSNAEAAGLYVLLDLHWIHPQGLNISDPRGGQYDMPDNQATAFWQTLAQKYANDPQVLFEMMNEPHGVSCSVWKNGGTVNQTAGGWSGKVVAGIYQTPGFQTLVNTIRNTGANNMIIQGASGESDLSCVQQNPLTDSSNNLAYQSHFYHTNPANGWVSKFQNVVDSYPVIAGEFSNNQYANVLPVFENQLHTGYLAWAWHTGEMITSYTTGAPYNTLWQSVKDFMLSQGSTSIQIQSSQQPASHNTSGTTITLPLGLDAIGNTGDQVNPQAKGNQSPRHSQRQITISLYNSSNTFIQTLPGSIQYDPSQGIFTATFISNSLASGTYTLYIKLPGFLVRKATATITANQNNTINGISLITGDMNNDNTLSILDYNILLSCFGGKFNISSCFNKSADINDDGVVDGIDYNLFLREFSKVQEGNAPPAPTLIPTATPTPTRPPATHPTPTPTPTQTASAAIRTSSSFNGVSLPPMGYNQYNHFANNINETIMKQILDAIATNGMRAAGYSYVGIDDSWAGGRNASGHLYTNSNFSSGIASLANYAHSKGLKFSIYTSPNTTTCAGRTGTGTNPATIATDMNDFASWGVDYVKLDWCNVSGGYTPQGALSIIQNYEKAIQATGRPMVLSTNYGGSLPITQSVSTSINMWRTGEDICSSWYNHTQAPNSAAKDCYNQQYHYGIYDYLTLGIPTNAPYETPGHFADEDMLEVGNPGLSFDEAKTHFSMWAMWAAPLIAGNDPRNMGTIDQLLLNTDIIAIDQDPKVQMAQKVTSKNGIDIWVKKLQGNAFAVAFVNMNGSPASISISWNQLNIPNNLSGKDLWTHQSLGNLGSSFTTVSIPLHGIQVIKAQ